MSTSTDRTILLLGDSLIEYGNWQHWLRPYKALNYGLAGETVEGLVERLSVILQQHTDVWLFVFMTGINNVAMDDYGFIPIYERILNIVKECSPDSHIIVCSLLPVDLEWVDNLKIEEINGQLRALCLSMNAEFLDLYHEFISSESRPRAGYLSEDGVHLSEQGYRQWTALLLQAVKRLPR